MILRRGYLEFMAVAAIRMLEPFLTVKGNGRLRLFSDLPLPPPCHPSAMKMTLESDDGVGAGRQH
jgi:hypothetical protein